MKEYMSDKELDEFINEIENEQIKAPFYLKKEIINKAFQSEDERIVEFNNTKLNKKKNNEKISKKQFYIYSFKVCASVAAAIVLLFLIPNRRDSEFLDTQKYNAVIEENMQKISNGITDVFDKFSKVPFAEYLNIEKK